MNDVKSLKHKWIQQVMLKLITELVLLKPSSKGDKCENVVHHFEPLHLQGNVDAKLFCPTLSLNYLFYEIIQQKL